MKSFMEWLRCKNESHNYTGYFLGRKLLCLNCGHTWENKDKGLNVWSNIEPGSPALDIDPDEGTECPKCHTQSDGEGGGVIWDSNDNWREPDVLHHDYGPGGDPSDNQDQDYEDREPRRPEY